VNGASGTLKRYALFQGLNYYPSGGWNDFVGAFDTPLEAFAYENKNLDRDWRQVVDLQTGVIIKP
jgi:hypothetical protein